MESTKKQKEWKAKNYKKNKKFFSDKQKERRKEIKLFIESHKQKCIVCNEKDVACLDFHHRDASEKLDTVATSVKDKWGEKRIMDEINKCDVVCSNCHRKIHYYNISPIELKQKLTGSD
jgi:hypothetical protein